MLQAHAMVSASNAAASNAASPGGDLTAAKKAAAAANAFGEQSGRVKTCIFCRLSQQSYCDNSEYLQEHQEYLLVTDDVFVVPDIKPSATHHVLVISHEHIKSPKALTRKDIPLVKHMAEAALKVLKAKNHGKDITNDYRIGFHWPPLVMIKHLHMHAFYPLSTMSAINRQLIFKPGFLFVTPEWLIERLQKIDDE